MPALCKIVIKKGLLFLTMPNGDIIPMQQNIVIENKMDDNNISTVTVTLLCDTKEIKNID